MDNTNTANVNEKIYLVTQKCDVKALDNKKILGDLSQLKTAEERNQKKIAITFGKKDNEVTRAMSALSIMNPFKGV